ncbi:UNVERIFIED_CONTAM: oxaloacetate decarboxylase gamma subunit [Acetivibrio alkalicellulosi]
MINLDNLEFGISITILGVSVVFSALVFLCILLYFFPFLNQRPKKISTKEEHSDESSYLEIEDDDKNYTEDTLSDNSLIAVLTAAVMASMRNGPDIKVRVTSYKRIPQSSPVWNTTGRNEHISGKM